MRMRRKGRAAGGNAATGNPIQVLTSFAPFIETSIVPQTQTKVALNTSGIISGLAGPDFYKVFNPAITTSFNVVVTVVLYCPGHPGDISVYDFTGNQPDGTPAQKRNYTKIFQKKFGKGYRMAQFILNNIPPIDGKQVLVVTHPPCKRRAVLSDQIVNLASNPVDVQVTKSGKNGQVSSGLTSTTKQDFEIAYGAVAIGGNYGRFTGPADYIPINAVGSNIDEFDVNIKTFYKLTSNTDTYRITADLSSGKFDWTASLVTFKALTI